MKLRLYPPYLAKLINPPPSDNDESFERYQYIHTMIGTFVLEGEPGMRLTDAEMLAIQEQYQRELERSLRQTMGAPPPPSGSISTEDIRPTRKHFSVINMDPSAGG